MWSESTMVEEKPSWQSDVPCPNCGRDLIRPIGDKTGEKLYCWYCDEEFIEPMSAPQFGERVSKNVA